VVTWAAFALFFWVFVALASILSASGGESGLAGPRLRQMAEIVSPALIPIALAYLLAHNLTQLLVVGPLIVTARDATASQLGALTQDQIRHLSPGVVWWTQAGLIVLGHVVAVVMAHSRLAPSIQSRRATRAQEAGLTPGPMLVVGGRAREAAVRADLGWLSAMLIYTATSLWILAQPITASGR
jgi:hypothetical protein